MPLIAVTGGHLTVREDADFPFLAAREQYFKWLQTAGGSGVLIPDINDRQLLNFYADKCAGLLLTGGGDIHPKHYRQDQHQMTGAYHNAVDLNRDETELDLFSAFMKLNKPILGICRGCQLINVALGGTLTHDLTLKIPGLTETHIIPDMDYADLQRPAHDINIVQDTKLFHILDANSCQVNSGHHQMVDQPGNHIRISATSPQGVIEAIENPDYPFMLGVQWHPEQLSESQESQKLLKKFITCC